eukprot:1676325-Alexandrium_andersonii.AAC.1
MAVGEIGIHRLRQDIGRIPLAGPFDQREIAGAHTLLHPRLSYCEAPRAPTARATANANRRAAIGADLKGGQEAETSSASLELNAMVFRVFDRSLT